MRNGLSVALVLYLLCHVVCVAESPVQRGVMLEVAPETGVKLSDLIEFEDEEGDRVEVADGSRIVIPVDVRVHFRKSGALLVTVQGAAMRYRVTCLKGFRLSFENSELNRLEISQILPGGEARRYVHLSPEPYVESAER